MSAPAKKRGDSKAKRPGGLSPRVLMGGFVLLPVIALLLPTCIVLLVGLAPSAVACIVDRTREKSQTVTIGLLNLCGVLPGILDLWSRHQSYAAAAAIAGDPYFWLLAYGAAGIGWAIYLVLPLIVGQYYAAATSSRIAALRRRQATLVEAWGKEVTGGGAAEERK